MMEDKKMTEQEEKRNKAIKKIVDLLNENNLTIITEHSIKIVPKEKIK